MTATAGWENFYVIVGSSAGALIGLQFVVITLVADRPALRTAEAGAAFATPSVVRFGTVLLLFIGIHNAWDAVTYHVFVKRRAQQEAERRPAFQQVARFLPCAQ